jgi:hypothetical protein
MPRLARADNNRGISIIFFPPPAAPVDGWGSRERGSDRLGYLRRRFFDWNARGWAAVIAPLVSE